MDNFLCKFDQFVEYDQPLPTIPILSAPFCYCSTGLSRVLNLLIDDVRYESAHQAPTLKDQKKKRFRTLVIHIYLLFPLPTLNYFYLSTKNGFKAPF